MDLNQIKEQLDAVDKALDEIDSSQPLIYIFVPLQTLMHSVFNVGVTLGTHQGLKSQADIKTRLSKQGKQFSLILPLIDYFTSRWERRLWGEWTGRWIDLCFARSSLEFLLNVYQDTALTTCDAPLRSDEFEDFDENIKALQKYEGGVSLDDIPAGVPESHWWWH